MYVSSATRCLNYVSDTSLCLPVRSEGSGEPERSPKPLLLLYAFGFKD